MSTPDPGRPPSTTRSYAFPVPGGAAPPDYLTDTKAFADAVDATLKALLEIDPWHFVGQPGEPPFGPGWRNDPQFGGDAGFPFASFRRYPSGLVLIRGTVSASPTTMEPIFTLPAPYRPVGPLVYAAEMASNNHMGVCVNTDGTVTTEALVVARLSMNMSFPAEPEVPR